MQVLLALVRIVGPMLLKGAETGTLVEIADTVSRLVALLRPLVADPQAQDRLEQMAAAVSGTVTLAPAQPEDPVFARQGQHHFGGR